MVSLARINLWEIVVAHLRTLRRLGHRGIYAGDIILFFVIPAIAAMPLAYFFGDRLYDQAAKLLTSISLIGGFLFNLLGRVGQIVDKVRKDAPAGSVRRVFAKELHSNVSFGIIAALTCSLCLVAFSFMAKPTVDMMRLDYGYIAVAWLNYFLCFSFFLTLLMIVKRMFIILSSDVEDM